MILLSEATNTLLSSVVHHVTDEYGGDLSKPHRAIRASGNRLLFETGLGRTLSTITLNPGDGEADVTAASGASSFLSGLLRGQPFIASGQHKFRRLDVVSFETISKVYRDSPGATGVPEIIAWSTPSKAYLYPAADAEYEVSFLWDAPLTPFVIGTYSPVELNVPETVADEWLWWLARAYLLMGAPGHPDAGPAMQRGEQWLRDLKGRVHLEGVHHSGPGDSWESNYRVSGYV